MALFSYPPIPLDKSGLATEAKQDVMISELMDVNTELDAQTVLLTSLDGKDFATQTTLAALETKAATETTLASLEAKASTEAKQDAIITELQDIDANTADNATETTLSALNAKVVTVDTTGKATEAKQDAIIAELQGVNSKTPVDFLDSGLVDTSSTAIPVAGLTVVASLAADCTELEIIDDIGEFMTITDGSDAVLAYLPLGGGRVKLSIASGTTIKLASLTGSDITLGNIAINFLD